MFSSLTTRAANGVRYMSSSSSLPKVAVVGAAGGIGQSLSLLLKMSPYVGELALSDVVNAPGVAADLSHIDKPGKVTGYKGAESMHDALKDAKLVVIPAGVPRKPGMTRDDLFNTNAGIVQSIAQVAAKACPNAYVALICNPVNSLASVYAETLKKEGVYDKRKLFGVTSLDIVRANTFVAEVLGKDPQDFNVTVCGGHAGTTIMPILSGVPGANFTDEQVKSLTHRIQFGGDEVVQAKDGAGSATLSMAYAAAVFSEKLLRAAAGEKDIVECAYVESPVAEKDGCTFFSTPVRLGPNGVEEIMPLPSNLSASEQKNYDEMVKDLAAQIKKGVDFCA